MLLLFSLAFKEMRDFRLVWYSGVKNLPANAGDLGSIPRVEKSLSGENDNPF